MNVRMTAIAAALLLTLAASSIGTPAASLPPPVLASLPLALDGWRGEKAPDLSEDVAEVLAADEYVHRYYRGPQGILEMDISYYSQPRVGANMHSPLNCLPGNGWAVTSVNTRSIQAAGQSWPVRELMVERGSTKYALTYWFHGRQRVIADEVSARFYVLADALRRRPSDAGLVRLMTPVKGNGEAERALLASFAQRLMPELNARLR